MLALLVFQNNRKALCIRGVIGRGKYEREREGEHKKKRQKDYGRGGRWRDRIKIVVTQKYSNP